MCRGTGSVGSTGSTGSAQRGSEGDARQNQGKPGNERGEPA